MLLYPVNGYPVFIEFEGWVNSNGSNTKQGDMMLKQLLAMVFMISSVCAANATGTEKTDQSAVPGFQPAGRPAESIFQPVAVDPALVRQSMQARAEYDRINRDINAYKTKLYEENAEIKDLQMQMRELQGKIDVILDADEELQKLKAQQQEISPELPAGARPFPLAPQPPPAGRPAPDAAAQPKQP